VTSVPPEDERRNISVTLSVDDLIELERLAKQAFRKHARDQASAMLAQAIADARTALKQVA
jgi:hypothetical protein